MSSFTLNTPSLSCSLPCAFPANSKLCLSHLICSSHEIHIKSSAIFSIPSSSREYSFLFLFFEHEFAIIITVCRFHCIVNANLDSLGSQNVSLLSTPPPLPVCYFRPICRASSRIQFLVSLSAFTIVDFMLVSPFLIESISEVRFFGPVSLPHCPSHLPLAAAPSQFHVNPSFDHNIHTACRSKLPAL
jgi:hypothetical protein